MVYAIGLLVGERLRDHLYGLPMAKNEPVPDKERIPGSLHLKKDKKWKRYSGLFVLLKQKWSLTSKERRAILDDAWDALTVLVHPSIPTHD